MNADRPPVAIITGGSKGIGAGLVQGYRQQGWAVLASARTIKPSADPDLVTVEGDISEPATAERIIAAALEHFGQVDTLVNNAGVYVSKPFTDYSAADYALVTGVNLAGFFRVTQLAITEMLRRGRGHVVNLAASIADRPQPGTPALLAALTKGGLAAAARSLAVEYADRGIRVNAVAPGEIETTLPAADTGGAGPALAAAAPGPGQRRGRRRLVPGVSAPRHRRDPAHRRRRASQDSAQALSPIPSAPIPQPRSRQAGRSGRQAQFAGDEQALDLRGALADLQDLGVAVETADRVFVHEAVAAEDLGRVAGVVHGGVGGGQLGDGRLLLERLAGQHRGPRRRSRPAGPRGRGPPCRRS